MKALALGVLTIGLIAACGSDKDPPVILADAAVDAPTVCNPSAQTGCATGEKCTWIIDIDRSDTSSGLGHTGCAPAGSIANDAACDPATAAVGFDSCVAGSLCISGKCKPICDPISAAGAVGACSADYVCARYSRVFATTANGSSTAGVCEPGCDPLTQRLNVGDLEACGSPDPAEPSAACVQNDGTLSSFGCGPVLPDAEGKPGTGTIGRTDREPAFTDEDGEIFVNSCAPGYIPYFLDQANGTMTLCTGMCAPTDVDQDLALAAKGAGNPNLNAGDPTVEAKLVTEAVPAVGNATCMINKKGSIAAANENGDGVEDCRYLWYVLLRPGDTFADVGSSPYNDTMGLCFNYNAFMTIDADGDPMMQPDAFEKSCKDLPATASATDPFGSAAENGCYSYAKTAEVLGAKLRKRVQQRSRIRLAHGTGAAVRHVFD